MAPIAGEHIADAASGDTERLAKTVSEATAAATFRGDRNTDASWEPWL